MRITHTERERGKRERETHRRMRFGYKFSGLMGKVYSNGRVIFTAEGSTIVSIVGNKISVFDCLESKSKTLNIQHISDIKWIALSPDNSILLSIDMDNNLFISNFKKEVLISGMKIKGIAVNALQFSPNGKLFAVGVDTHIQLWKTPALHKQFAPFVLYRDIVEQHTEDVHHISWTNNSQFILSAARDNSVMIHKVEQDSTFITINLFGHRSPLIGSFWDSNDSTV